MNDSHQTGVMNIPIAGNTNTHHCQTHTNIIQHNTGTHSHIGPETPYTTDTDTFMLHTTTDTIHLVIDTHTLLLIHFHIWRLSHHSIDLHTLTLLLFTLFIAFTPCPLHDLHRVVSSQGGAYPTALSGHRWSSGGSSGASLRCADRCTCEGGYRTILTKPMLFIDQTYSLCWPNLCSLLYFLKYTLCHNLLRVLIIIIIPIHCTFFHGTLITRPISMTHHNSNDTRVDWWYDWKAARH